jgi:oligoribonuclease NrnB/cAMP/cGMP phosphodiesterase (DHH superfamily)
VSEAAKRPLVIFHANCMDGFTSAWVANQFLDDAELRPMLYTDEPPTDEEVSERRVYVVDFSFKRAVCDRLFAATNHQLVVLDHHKTAEAELAGVPYAVFDMNRSGAGIAWDYFNPDVPRPWLVDYVEDRDLWRFKLPLSREANAAINCAPMTLEAWDKLSAWGYEMAAVKGEGALAFEQMCARMAAETACMVEFEGHVVPCVNVPYTLVSTTAGLLAEKAPFAIGWFQKADGTFQYSLRSRGEGGVDVSEVAKKYGGGGHRNASGFTLEYLITDQDEGTDLVKLGGM